MTQVNLSWKSFLLLCLLSLTTFSFHQQNDKHSPFIFVEAFGVVRPSLSNSKQQELSKHQYVRSWYTNPKSSVTKTLRIVLQANTKKTNQDGDDGSRSSNNNSTGTTSTKQLPLYDGTNYTFPDTTTPKGIAELLEVSFVHACMQLRTGYVDVLKLFIAAASAGYDFRFPISPTIIDELESCTTETAGRPLAEEEISLRTTWISLIYLTLLTNEAAKNNNTIDENKASLLSSIPETIRTEYGSLVESVVQVNTMTGGTTSIPNSVLEELLNDNIDDKELSIVEKAILSQSMRVIGLTLDVQREAAEANAYSSKSGGSNNDNKNNDSNDEDTSVPTPPIPGAFE